jgi:small-conductance mechanosensitive channel
MAEPCPIAPVYPPSSRTDAQDMNYVETLQRQIDAMVKGFVQALPSLMIALIILIITWGAARLGVRIVARLTGRTHIRMDLRQLVETLVRLGVWIVGFMIAMTIAIPSLTPASLFAGLGVGALAIGFAFQDIFENFLAGVLIMLREKMHIGDSVECESISGSVEKITLRETHIRQYSGELTIVPNSQLFKNPVKILTDQTLRRSDLVVGVSYDADLTVARDAIYKALDAVEGIHRDKPVDVFAQSFNSSSIDFQIWWWTNSIQHDLRAVKADVIFAIKQGLDDAGIEIPFPYLTHTFKEPLPVAVEEDPAR